MFFRKIIKPEFSCHFNNGPVLEMLSGHGPYKAIFSQDGEVVHSAWLEAGQWVRAHRQYFTEWEVEVVDHRYRRVFYHRFDLSGKSIRINFDSKSLGDTLAWMAQAERFAQIHTSSTVFVSHFWPDLFAQSSCSNLKFIDPESVVEPCYASYSIGCYFDDAENCHPADIRLCSLGQVASDILGIEYEELRPVLASSNPEIKLPEGPYVAIATASTAECKHWLYSDGWQTVVNWLQARGYQVMVIQMEPTSLEGVIDESGDQDIVNRIAQLEGASAFVGLGSGLSWLAWACAKRVVMISGFSEAFSEFQQDCYRVINEDVCHGCWNDPQYTFKRDDWEWCPRHQGTVRQHECSKEISAQMVIRQLELALLEH